MRSATCFSITNAAAVIIVFNPKEGALKTLEKMEIISPYISPFISVPFYGAVIIKQTIRNRPLKFLWFNKNTEQLG